MAAVLLLGGALSTGATVTASLADVGATMVRPPWTYAMEGHDECFDASASHAPQMENNTRWTHWAVPAGEPPPGGWPLVITFEVMGFYPMAGDNATCGNGWHQHYGPPTPATCNALLEASCSAAKATGNRSVCQHCTYRLRRDHNASGAAGCRSHDLGAFCEPARHRHTSPYKAFALPDEVFQGHGLVGGEFSADGNGTWNSSHSYEFDSHAGMLWLQRAKQYLLANGVAWLILNPYEGDSWDWDTEADWMHGLDQPFLRKLFAAIRNGSYPAPSRGNGGAASTAHGGGSAPLFNADRVIPLGWSAGAQMVSWMIELTASGRFPEAKLTAGIFLSGGSHKCYLNNPRSSTQRCPAANPQCPEDMPDWTNVAVGSCAKCNSSHNCGEVAYGQPYNESSAAFMRGCSNDFGGHTSNHPQQPCCQYCCPQNYTEQWFKDHPGDYKNKHPPAFLVQMRTKDINADLCAGSNYHDELRKHGVRSTLALVPAADERCFCIGTPGGGAPIAVTEGNPFGAAACPIIPPDVAPRQHYRDGHFHCEDHTMGFAAMVEPMTEFVLEALRNNSRRSMQN
jgi:hypothetical protein